MLVKTYSILTSIFDQLTNTQLLVRCTDSFKKEWLCLCISCTRHESYENILLMSWICTIPDAQNAAHIYTHTYIHTYIYTYIHTARDLLPAKPNKICIWCAGKCPDNTIIVCIIPHKKYRGLLECTYIHTHTHTHAFVSPWPLSKHTYVHMPMCRHIPFQNTHTYICLCVAIASFKSDSRLNLAHL